MDRVTLTENELLELLREAESAQDDVPDAYTLPELVRVTGKPDAWLRARLGEAMARGDVQPVKVPRPNAWGDMQRRPAYRFRRAA